jgi:hypothetical protein
VRGLGLLPYSNCVHYDAEPQRRAEYHRFVGDGMRPGFAAEDGVALHFRRTRLQRAVSSRADGCAYRVEHTGDGVVETPLEVSYLGAEAAPQTSAEAQRAAAAAAELATQAAEPAKSRRPRRRSARRSAPSAKAELLPVSPEPLPA